MLKLSSSGFPKNGNSSRLPPFLPTLLPRGSCWLFRGELVADPLLMAVWRRGNRRPHAHPASSFQPFETFGKLGHLVECVPGD